MFLYQGEIKMKTELEISKMLESLIEAQKMSRSKNLNIILCGEDRIDAGINTLKWVMEE